MGFEHILPRGEQVTGSTNQGFPALPMHRWRQIRSAVHLMHK
jgi:hypothetical protein